MVSETAAQQETLTRITTRIQAHPARSHLHDNLQERLGVPSKLVLHESVPTSPWAGYKLCLERVPKNSTHLLIVQDDAYPCENFAPALKQVAEAHPTYPVCLFLARLPREASAKATQAMKRNKTQRYVQLSWRNFMPVVAVLWPRQKAVEFAEWADSNPALPGQPQPRSDDAMAGVWKMRERQTVYATVPSLVEHPDMEPSLIGKRAAWGKDKNRCAVFFAEDGLKYDWSVV